MANEITVTMTARVVNGSFKAAFEPATKQITQSAIGAHCPVWNVGTSEEDLSLGDISTPGVIGLLNTDTTNYVQIGPKSGGAMVPIIKLKPGEPAFFRLDSGVTLRAVANAAACKVMVWALEN